MNEKELINYYNKFKEDKRLDSKHGQVEFLTAVKYIEKYLSNYSNPKILDIGAGTGKYSIYFHNKGYNIEAVELVKQNLNILKKKNSSIKSYLGNATNLNFLSSNSYDIILLFGPIYHLISNEEKILALNEAKRLLKKDGIIFISYCMNEYAIITHGFKENYILDSINNKQIDNKYHIISSNNDLYSYVRIKDINKLNKLCKLKRIKIIAQDTFSEYLKKEINSMNEETFNIYLNYHFNICESKYLLEMSRHCLDIVKKRD